MALLMKILFQKVMILVSKFHKINRQSNQYKFEMNIVDVTVVLHVNFLIKLNISSIYTKAKYSAVSCVLMILKSCQFNVDLFLLYPTVISGCFIQSLMKRQEPHSNLRRESIYEELLNITAD